MIFRATILVFILLAAVAAVVARPVIDSAINQWVAAPVAFEKTIVEINGQKLIVEIADTPIKRSRGLSHRQTLGENEGMYFYGYAPSQRFALDERFMNFATDVVWFNDQRVVDLTFDVKPNPQPVPITLVAPVDAFLEINAGQINALNIKIGDRIIRD